jgi:hypothetical protein
VEKRCGELRSERVFNPNPTGNLRKWVEISGFHPHKAFGGIYRIDLPLG